MRATATFTPEYVVVTKGSVGRVAEINEDGVFPITFEGLDGTQVVFEEKLDKSDLANISVLSQADVLKERTQRKELVEMLIAPTQSAGALDVQNDEGTTALMHAIMYGLCGVVELLVAAGARPELIDKCGMTALLLACANSQVKPAISWCAFRWPVAWRV